MDEQKSSAIQGAAHVSFPIVRSSLISLALGIALPLALEAQGMINCYANEVRPGLISNTVELDPMGGYRYTGNITITLACNGGSVSRCRACVGSALYIEEEGGYYDGYSYVTTTEDYISFPRSCGVDSNIPIYTTYYPVNPTAPGQDYKVRLVFGPYTQAPLGGEDSCEFFAGNDSVTTFTVP